MSQTTFLKTVTALFLASLLLIATSSGYAAAQSPSQHFSNRKDVQEFINYMVKHHGFDKTQLATLFDEVKVQQAILFSISHPAEAKPWDFYYNLFITQSRIDAGVLFWQTHKVVLDRVEKRYGVPSSVILAILGVETLYGKNQGQYRVIDALSTLAFEYPPRQKYFRSELEQYLLLTRENHIDPTILKGSYAGAIGQPQFMPSSYRHYAVDYSRNRHIDLQNNTDDVIASVANYLKKNGWKQNELVALPAKIEGDKYKQVIQKRVRPKYTLEELQSYGIQPVIPTKSDEKASLFSLNKSGQPEYWLSFNNFYTITRYNTSTNYAMAVHYLANALEEKMAASEKPPSKKT